jgi:hypothetical protein
MAVTSFDTPDQVASQPLRYSSGKRRDDDLDEVALPHRVLDGFEWVRSADQSFDLELARDGVALNIIQRPLGHSNLGTTSIYLQGIDPEEIITAVRTPRAPLMSASAGLRL